jgi:hypothetical protein
MHVRMRWEASFGYTQLQSQRQQEQQQNNNRNSNNSSAASSSAHASGPRSFSVQIF